MYLLQPTSTIDKRIIDITNFDNNDYGKVFNMWNKMNGNKVTNRMRAVLPDFFDSFRTTVHREWKKGIKAYIQDKSDRQYQLMKLGLDENSNLYKGYIKNLSDKLFNRLYDTEIDLQVTAKNPKFSKGEEVIKAVAKKAFVDVDNRNNLFTSIKHQIVAGNGFGKAVIGFQEMDDGLHDIQLKFKHVPLFNLFFNINTDFYNSGMPVVERNVLPIKEALEEIKWIVTPSKDIIDFVLTNRSNINDYDDNRVWDLWAYQNDLHSKLSESFRTGKQGGDVFNYMNDGYYQINKYTNDVCELIHYWEDNNLVIMLNGYVIYDGNNPLGRHPYINFTYDSSLGRNISRGVSIVHQDEQLEYNAIYNSFFDQIRRASIEMYLKTGNGKIKGVNNGVLKPQHGKVFETDGDAKLDAFDTVKLDPNVLSIMQYISAEGSAEAGLTGYTGGDKEGIERSPFAAQALVQITIQALKPAVEGISRGLTHCVGLRQMYLRKYFGEQDVEGKIKVKIFNNDFKDLTMKIIGANYDILFSNKSIVTLYNEERRLKKIQTLQMIQSFATDPVTQQYLLEQDTVLRDLLLEGGYDVSTMLSENEYFKKQQQFETQKIDTQMLLINKQMELEMAKQTLLMTQQQNAQLLNQAAAQNVPQPTPQNIPPVQQPNPLLATTQEEIDIGEL